jgi:xylan 1,4-beta-xylosidase
MRGDRFVSVTGSIAALMLAGTAMAAPAAMAASAATPASSRAAKSAASPARVIAVDVGRVKGPHDKSFRVCVGAGRANEGLRADWQQQLATVRRECGFRYVRFHGLLHDDMDVYRETRDGRAVYNWQYVDKLYDAILEAGVRPFVELGFMPSALASGTKTIFWWKGNVTPPKSYDKWAELIDDLMRHWQERYGRDEVKTWYFEVWNEPDLRGFFNAELPEYLKLYEVTARAVKGISRSYRVGGPASASPYAYEEALLAHCVKNGIPLDFISTHSYGVKEGFLDETGYKGTVLDPDPAAVRSRMLHSRELIAASPRPSLELHFTEWSSSYTPTDPIHDSYHQAAFILDKIKGAQEAVTSMSYWVFTDVFEENGPRMTPFHGGFGLLNYQGIKKPAYYAYRYAAQLGPTELTNADPASWVTRDTRGGVQALFWDFTPAVLPEGMNDQEYFKRDLPARSKGTVRLQLSHLPAGKYALQIFKVGYRVNDAYATYLDLGAPAQLTPHQVETIQTQNDGAPLERALISIDQGTFVRDFDLRENDVVLVALDPA